MENLEEKLHRTWIALLIDGGLKDAASVVLDATITLLEDNYQYYGFSVDLPPSAAITVQTNSDLAEKLEKSLKVVARGYIEDQNGYPLDVDEITIKFRIKLMEPEEGWKENVRRSLSDDQESHMDIKDFIEGGDS